MVVQIVAGCEDFQVGRLSCPDGAFRQEFGDPLHDITHRANALRGLIGNIDVELAFHRE
jgi:hypothetical protein